MKKILAIALTLILLLGLVPALAETTGGEAPMLAERVEKGELPPLAERLPAEPKVFDTITDEYLDYQIGTYGGTLRTASTSIGSSDTVNRMLTEPLFTYQNMEGAVVTGNVLKGYELSEDETTFTFYMREGMKWSDGMPVTTADVAFTFNDLYLNEEYTSTFPAWLRTGGNASAAPATLEIVDDYTFKLIFDGPYAGLLMRLAIKNWCAYYDLINPSHYLKQFHPAYADEAELAAMMEEEGYETWVALFNYKMITQFEEGQEAAIGYPVLNAWMASEYNESYWVMERNPYYFTTDREGNQLPYIDYIRCEYVQDAQIMQMKMVSGEIDYEGFKGSLNNMALYTENAEANGYKIVMTNWHVTGNDLYLALAHNPEEKITGILNNRDFREALNYALNKQDVIDTIYLGFADASTITPDTYDPAKANEMLDAILPMGTDGWRTYPDGTPFSIQCILSELAPDIAPTSELIAAMLADVGIKFEPKIVDSSLRAQMIAAAEHEAVVMWTEILWFNMGQWMLNEYCTPWYTWWTSGGAAGVEPPQEFKELFSMYDSMHGGNIENSLKLFEEINRVYSEQLYIIRFAESVQQPLIVNRSLGNTEFKKLPWGINVTFAGEVFFFNEAA